MPRYPAWWYLLPLLLAACNGNGEGNHNETKEDHTGGNAASPREFHVTHVRVGKTTFPLETVSLSAGEEISSKKPDGKSRLVLSKDTRYENWKLAAGWMILFLDQDDQIVEIHATATGGGNGITSSREYDRALLLPEIMTVRIGSSAHFTTRTSVRIGSSTWPLKLVSLATGREIVSGKPGSVAYLLLAPRAYYQYWQLSAGWTIFFLDKDDWILEYHGTSTGGGPGITSTMEHDRVLLVPNVTTLQVNSQVRFMGIPPSPLMDSLGKLKLGGEEVFFERAETPEERYNGLMWRKRLSKNTGMLFFYPEPDDRRFWMGNCLLDLDIAFFRADRSLINVVEMDRYPDPSTDPGDRAASAEPAKYVLELNQGWFRKRNLVDDEGRPARLLRFEINP